MLAVTLGSASGDPVNEPTTKEEAEQRTREAREGQQSNTMQWPRVGWSRKGLASCELNCNITCIHSQ